MRPLGKVVLIATILAAVLLGRWILFRKSSDPEAAMATRDTLLRDDHLAGPRSGADPSADESPTVGNPGSAAAPAASELHRIFNDTMRLLRTGNGAQAKAVLAKVKLALRSVAPQVAIAEIRAFLEGGEDAPAGGFFTVGEGGVLENAPSFRVFLLDQLGLLARESGSTEGAEIARGILGEKRSADEWAIALRNVAWSEKGTEPFLAEKLREMLHEPAWRAAPTPGMLEAFDVAVYTRDVLSISVFAELVKEEASPLRRAAAVALDRLGGVAPLEVMNTLNGTPGLLADVPMIRADLYSKADVSQPAQRLAVETYLGRSDVNSQEKGKFLDGLFVPGAFVSENLLTPPVPPVNAPQRMATVEQVAREWMEANRFPELQATLAELLERSAAE